jgi:hypothetical protein
VRFKVFYTDVPLRTRERSPDLTGLVPLERDTRDAAMNLACELLGQGAIVWRIEGPDGSLGRQEIEEECRRRERAPNAASGIARGAS